MLPVPWIAVGVTGHRHPRLPHDNSAAVEAAIGQCLARIRDEAARLVAGDGDCLADAELHCRLVTSLAEGSDTIAARAALQADFRIDACLPFDREEFAKDFSGDALAHYRSALESCRTVTELPGNRANELAAYEAAGRMVLDQSDLLIAVWDGSPALGRGGTAEIVAEAVLAHVPVVMIGIDGSGPTMLWSGLDEAGHDRPTVEGVPRCDFEHCIAKVMQTLIAPPTNELDLMMIRRWAGETDHRRTPALGYPFLMAAVAGKPLSRRDFRPDTAADCRQPFEQWIGMLPEMGQLGQRLRTLVAPRFGRADAAASYFAQLFRSGFIVNFIFAALAVLCGLMGLLVPHGKLYFAIAELTVIAIILVNTRSARSRGWHERWMDNRHLAERLRVLALSATLGDPDLRVDSDNAGSLPGWVQWMTRATGRELGLPAGLIDKRYLDRVRLAMLALVEEQIDYNHRNAERMERVERRLHSLGELLFAITVLACGAWIVGKLLRPDLMIGEGVGPTQWATVTTAFFPALGAAIYGIRMQGDFHGLAHRSETTAKLLSRLKRAIDCDPSDYEIMKDRVKRLGDILLMDVERWRTTYQARPLHLPG